MANDGTVTGTPTVLGANVDLVIRVTDSMSTTAEITLSVADTLINPDDRAVVSTVTATTTDILDEIVGYGKNMVIPTFTITNDSQVKFGTRQWKKYDGSEWKWNDDTRFTEGKYRFSVQMRTDSTTHVLDKKGVTFTVNGEKWTQDGTVYVGDDFSYVWFYSKEYEVIKTTTITDELVPVTDIEKVFDDNPQEPTFSGALVRGTDYEVSYAVKEGSTGSLTFGGIPIGAGTYIVTVTGKGAYSGSFTKEFVINKAEQTAPDPSIFIANPISCDEGLGKIIGVTTTMEYRKVGDADFTACTSTTITGLVAGEYEIRYKEDNNYLAGAVAKVSVVIEHNFGGIMERQEPSCSATGTEAHYYCPRCGKYFDESKNEKTLEELTIPIDPTKHNFSDLVNEKSATCKEKGKMKYTATFVNTAFTMQEKEVDIDFAPHTFGAWKDEIPATTEDFGTKGHKDCTVCGKHFDEDGNEITELRIAKIGTHNVVINGESKFYAHGDSVTVTANEPAEGKVFMGWKDGSGNIVSTEKVYTFTVNGETTLTAVYGDKSSGGGEITPPAKKDGLSGGQIAGIVIGSVLLAGIGGFAIYWFAISKKTFADLGTAFKKFFEKIKNLFKKKK